MQTIPGPLFPPAYTKCRVGDPVGLSLIKSLDHRSGLGLNSYNILKHPVCWGAGGPILVDVCSGREGGGAGCQAYGPLESTNS